jgi:hypothetical protein
MELSGLAETQSSSCLNEKLYVSCFVVSRSRRQPAALRTFHVESWLHQNSMAHSTVECLGLVWPDFFRAHGGMDKILIAKGRETKKVFTFFSLSFSLSVSFSLSFSSSLSLSLFLSRSYVTLFEGTGQLFAAANHSRHTLPFQRFRKTFSFFLSFFLSVHQKVSGGLCSSGHT